MAHAMTETTERAKRKTTDRVKKETTDRAKTSKCVRLNDKKGFDTKFNKTKFQCAKRRKLFYFFVKCYEKLLRLEPPTAVADKKFFREFRRFAERLEPVPVGFHSFTNEQKRSELQKLIDKQEAAAAAALTPGRDQNVDMLVDNPDYIQVDKGRAAYRIPGIVNTLRPSDDGSLQNVAWNRLDKPQGRPPPNPYVHPYELDQFMSELKRRAFRFLGIKRELFEEFMLFVDKLDSLEELELSEALKDDSNTLLRVRQEEIYAELEADLTSEDPHNQLSMPLMEGIGPSGEDLQRDTANTMPHGEQHGLLPNQGISEALEDAPKNTGCLRTNIAVIEAHVHDNMAGDLQYQCSKPTMERYVGPQANHPDVYDPSNMQPDWENLPSMPYDVGWNNTSLVVPIDCLVPAVDERVLCVEEQQNGFDTPYRESSPNVHWSTYLRWPPELYSNTDTV